MILANMFTFVHKYFHYIGEQKRLDTKPIQSKLIYVLHCLRVVLK